MGRDDRDPARSAGCVVWRHDDAGQSGALEVVLVHRARYGGDLTLPKGTLKRHESAMAAALREVEEETGLRVRLGPRLRDLHYPLPDGRNKVVSYWAARPLDATDVAAYEANDEVDDVGWVGLTEAVHTLTYPRDVELLREFSVSAYDTEPLLVVRHAQALPRADWTGPDPVRPLTSEGSRDAEGRIAALLAAYGVEEVVTSDAARCVATVQPYAARAGAPLRHEPLLSEEGMTAGALTGVAARLLADPRPLAVCSHRPVLPELFDALGVGVSPLEPGGHAVIHRSGAQVRSVEKP